MSAADDAKRINARLAALPREILERLRPALVKSAEEVADNMRALVPVDEGELRDSIAVTGPGDTTPPYAEGGGKRTANENQALVTVGDEAARHGHLIEFGTVKMDAQPFMRPGFRIAKPRAERRIRSAIGRAIKKVTE